MKKILFLGSKQIGLECLKILNSSKNYLDFEIFGVLTNSRGGDIIKYCQNNDIKVFLDGDNGVTLKDCSSISSEIKKKLNQHTNFLKEPLG